MKKIFMVSLVAMMAVTAANADIASTTYVDTYVDTRAGEMQLDQNGNLTNAGYYVGTDQKLQFIGQADALNTAIGKLDDAIATQATEDGNTYVKKVEANEEKKGGTAGTFVYSVEQVEGDVTAAEGTFLGEIASGTTLTPEQVEAHKVAPQAGAVKSYVDGAISTQGTQVTNLSIRVGSVEEYIAGNKDKNIVSLDERLAAKQDVSDKDYQLGNKDGGWTTMSDAQQNALNSGVTDAVVTQVATNKTNIEKLDETYVSETEMSAFKTTNTAAINAKVAKAQGDTNKNRVMNTTSTGEVVAGQIKKDTTDTTPGSFITGLSVDNSGNLVYTDGKVSATDIEDGAVTTVKIANKAVTTAKIADKAVTTAQLSDEINTSLGNAVQRSQVGMPVDFAISEACKAQGVVCSLTIKGTGTGAVAQWEVVR